MAIRVEGRQPIEVGTLREWLCRVYDDDEMEIGHCRAFTVAELDEEALADCDCLSQDLERAMAVLCAQDELWGPFVN
ncbi:hypothetical protein IV102_02655 [bacterium]|nr:hypothetical protein [bacterium]